MRLLVLSVAVVVVGLVAAVPPNLPPEHALALSQARVGANGPLNVNVQAHFFLIGWDKLELVECAECPEGQKEVASCTATHDTQCAPDDDAVKAYTSFLPTDVGSGWKLVRRVQSGNSWHPATDHLQGTDVYGTFVDDPKSATTFSVKFDDQDFDQFLFITGDATKWAIVNKDEAQRLEAGLFDGTIVKASNGATKAKWYNRSSQKEDPWISISDHSSAVSDGNLVYGANSFSSTAHTRSVRENDGACVFIRKSA